MIFTRKAGETDFELSYKAKESGYRSHVEKIWGKWDDEWQRAEHRKDFAAGLLEIVTMNGIDAGYIYVIRSAQAIKLVDMAIFPEYQGKGIGTHLVKGLLAEARLSNLVVELGAFKTNLSAIKLYERLGFTRVSENNTHVRLSSK